MALKLKTGEEVTINIPFTYTIGEEGYHTGRTLETIEDCKAEVLAEIDAIEDAKTPTTLRNAFRKRADHIEKILIKIK